MKKPAPLTLLVSLTAALTTGAQAQTAPSTSALAAQMPAGALLTLETRDAGGAIDRIAGLLGRAIENVTGEEVPDFAPPLKGLLGQDAVVGVFSVGTAGRSFEPHVLASARVDQTAAGMVSSMITAKKGAKVGNFSFVRQGGMFVGQSAGLVYMSSNKDLLMAYLGRLSGRTAPRLNSAAAYTTPARSVGAQEMSLFVNFSATAKVIRAALAKELLPRLLSPIVDAIDTLGQYRAGFTTTATGIQAQAAHAVNTAGKDRTLAAMLTDSTSFEVQGIIPADIEAVVASACHPDTGSYAGRWLTRLDLFDPLGFLTDSQLAAHLERSSRYLGNECAQVTLAGGQAAGLDTERPLAALDYSVTYQRVRDMEAAQAAMPEYVQAWNEAIDGAAGQLKTLIDGQLKDDLGGMGMADLPPELARSTVAAAASLGEITDLVKGLKMVYAFRGDYLITAFSQKALDAAMAEGDPTLGDDADFQAAGLNMQNAVGWQYARAAEAVSAEQLYDAMMGQASAQELPDMMSVFFEPVAETLADLINRYDGLTSQSSVQGSVVTSKSTVRFSW